MSSYLSRDCERMGGDVSVLETTRPCPTLPHINLEIDVIGYVASLKCFDELVGASTMSE